MLMLFKDALVLGAVYGALALGYVVIFRGTSVVNFAHGQFSAIGAYLFFVVAGVTGAETGEWLALCVAVVLALAAGAVGGAAVYRTALAPLTGQPVWAVIIATMGIAVALDAFMVWLWGGRSRLLPEPVAPSVYRLSDSVFLRSTELTIVALAAAVAVAILCLYRFTDIGLRMRATAEQPLLAGQAGINVIRVFALAWAIGGLTATAGGVAYAYIATLSPAVVSIGIKALIPAIVGGLDSPGGAVLGGLLVGALDVLVGSYLGTEFVDPVAYAVLLAVLLLRPYGIFGTPQVERL